MKRNHTIKQHIFLIVLFSFCYMIMLLFIPRNLDDWTWGSSIGIDRLLAGFSCYNGRYLGNIAVIILTRLPVILASLIEAAIVGGILWEMHRLVKSKIALAISIILLLLMPRSVFTQTFGWMSGYANYVISLFTLVTYLILVKKFYKEKKNPLITIGLGVFGIAIQLFVENATLFFVMGSLFAVIYFFWIYKKINIYYLSMLVGNVIGAVIMFSNSAYLGAVANDGSSYKKIEVDMFSTAWMKQTWMVFVKNIIPDWFTKNQWLIIVLGIVAVIFCLAIKFKYNKVFLIANCMFTAFFVYLSIASDQTFYFEKIYSVNAIFIILFCIGLVLMSFLGITAERERLIVLLTLLSQIPLVLPLTVSTPISPRCFMESHVMFILYIAEILSYTLKHSEIFQNRKVAGLRINNYVVLFVSAFVVLRFGMDTNAGLFMCKAVEEKQEYIEAMVDKGEQTVTVPYIPFSDIYSVNINPGSKMWQENFNHYYGFPKEIRYSYVSYSEWKNDYYRVERK